MLDCSLYHRCCFARAASMTRLCVVGPAGEVTELFAGTF